MKQRLRHILVLVPTILLIVLAYSPGLHGPYVLDDGENITQNRAVAIHDLSFDSLQHALTSNESGPLKRPIAALSFAINHYLAGGFDNPFPFKLTNLIIHSINTVLVYFLVTLLLRTPAFRSADHPGSGQYAAGVIAAIWALHPLQLTSVLYVVQRMNSLSALFVFTGLIIFCHGRLRLEQGETKGLTTMYAGIGLGTVLGLGSKENAALLPLLAFVIEYTLFRGSRLMPTARKPILVFYTLTALAPIIAFAAYLLIHPEFLLNAYAERHFSLMERLLTQGRVLWLYFGLLLLPSSHRLGLFHDDMRLSQGLFDPFTTLPAVISIAALVWLAMTRAGRYPLLGFGILWFFVGHSLESSIFGLEIVYEHRNYLPSFGVIFAIVLAVWRPIKSKVQASMLTTVIPCVVILVLGFVTWNRSNTWSDIRNLADDSVRHHPASPRTNDFAARVALSHERNISKAIGYVMAGARAAPHEVGFHIDMRILLAILSSEINASLTEKSKAMLKEKAGIKIEGVPDGIRSIVNEDGVSLVYEPSSQKAITELLRDRPISVHAIVSIENLRRCLLEKPYPCSPFKFEALEWLITAGDNPKTSADYRALILSNTARIYASLHDYPHAYEYIDRATRLLPEKLSYQLGRIEYLIKLGHLDEARKLLDTHGARLAKPDAELTANRNTIMLLEDMYKNASSGGQPRIGRH